MSQSQSQTYPDVSVVGDDAQSSSIELTRSRSKKRSLVWFHFNEVGKTKAVCRHCSVELGIGPKLGTTHLLRHIRDVCQNISEEERERFTLGKGGDLFGGSNYKFDPELTQSLVTLLFIDAEIPFSVIESRFWEPTMRSLRPEYKAVGRQTLRNDCVGVFNKGVEVSLKEFDVLDSNVCFTSDIWTSSVNLGYLCLTAHYIDKSFNFQKKIIALKQISYPHAGQMVANSIEKVLVDWMLDGKIFTITLDNCSVNNNVIGRLVEKFGDKLIFYGKHMHMRCAAHILNIMVQDGKKIIHPALHKIRYIMRHIASSGSRLQMFNTIIDDLHLPSKRGMTLDCPTRWNSTYEMVSEALKYNDALIRYGDETFLDVPNVEEWKEAGEVAKILEVFIDATKTFSMVRRPSSHTYMRKVWTIRDILLDDEMSRNQTLQDFSIEMQKKFFKYWEDPNLILTLACVFDPRSKLTVVDFCFRDAYGDETNEYKERMEGVHSSLRIFYQKYESTTYATDRATSSGSPQVENIMAGKRKFEMRLSQFQSQNHNLRPKRSELENYLEEALVVSDEETFDILQWWKRNSDLYPILAKMARDFLAVQVSTVASESAFSAAGRLTDHLRSSMTAETIEALICSKDWFGSIDSSFDLNQFRPFMPTP